MMFKVQSVAKSLFLIKKSLHFSAKVPQEETLSTFNLTCRQRATRHLTIKLASSYSKRLRKCHEYRRGACSLQQKEQTRWLLSFWSNRHRTSTSRSAATSSSSTTWCRWFNNDKPSIRSNGNWNKLHILATVYQEIQDWQYTRSKARSDISCRNSLGSNKQ